jgi:hypothetical protein
MADNNSDSSPHGAECENCGAPDDGEHVLCKYCKSPITKDLLKSAITCPTCKAPNRAERTNCSACNGSLLMTCLFCGHQSPASFSDCQKCGQGFAGAAERKKQAETDHLIGTVTNFVGNLVGAAQNAATNAPPQTSYSSSNSNYSSSDNNYSSGSSGGYGGGSDGGAPPMDN